MKKSGRVGNSSWFGKMLGSLFPGLLSIDSMEKETVLQVIKEAGSQHIIDAEVLSIMEGALQVSDLQVRDIMIPRARMVVMNRDDSLDCLLPVAIESAHSRFPVIDEDKSEVVGILLAKDLLQYCGSAEQPFKMRDVIRSVVFVPESKRLNVLLREFRLSRNHMAIVVDEYGAAAGLVTIEDVLEQIVGEIEDEYDFDEGASILSRGKNEYTVKAHTAIEDFNEFFGSEFTDEDFDTVGGLVVNAIGHLPKRDESVEIGHYRFRVIRADSRRIRLLNVEKLKGAAEGDERPQDS